MVMKVMVTHSGPANESVCPGSQLRLSLSRLRERQQSVEPQIWEDSKNNRRQKRQEKTRETTAS